MKVTDVKPMILSSKAPGPGYFVVRVDTDAGIHGLGESGNWMWGESVAKAVEHLAELVIGQDPFSTERLWQHMFRGSFFPGDKVYCNAISAIDLALWDIKGKATGMPVYKLLGGPVRDKVVCYPHNTGNTTQQLLESCQETVAAGWKFVRFGMPESGESFASPFPSKGGVGQLEPLDSIPITVDLVGKVRDTLGPQVQILLDVHTRLDSTHVISLCSDLEPFKPYFIEDPIRSENPGSYRKLSRHINLPIAAGEQWPHKWAFREVIEEELIDYARVDVCNVGGLTEALKVAHWCETHYIDLAPHNPLGPVSAAASVALCMASTNVGVQEMPKAPGTVDTDLFPEQIDWENGYAIAPDRPGLGVEIDMEVAESAATRPRGFAPHLQRNDGAFTNW